MLNSYLYSQVIMQSRYCPDWLYLEAIYANPNGTGTMMYLESRISKRLGSQHATQGH